MDECGFAAHHSYLHAHSKSIKHSRIWITRMAQHSCDIIDGSFDLPILRFSLQALRKLTVMTLLTPSSCRFYSCCINDANQYYPPRCSKIAVAHVVVRHRQFWWHPQFEFWIFSLAGSCRGCCLAGVTKMLVFHHCSTTLQLQGESLRRWHHRSQEALS